MKTFTDTAGRTWTLAINVTAVKRVRGLVNVDLLEAIEGKLTERLLGDLVLLCDVLYAVVKPEADAQNVSDEEFGRALAGDVIANAAQAFFEELADFSLEPTRTILRRTIEAAWKAAAKVKAAVEERVASGELDRVIESALASVSGSSGSSPAPPASTPAR